MSARASAEERDVAQVGDAGCGCGEGVGCSAVIAEDLPGLHLPDGVLDPSPDPPVHGQSKVDPGLAIDRADAPMDVKPWVSCVTE